MDLKAEGRKAYEVSNEHLWELADADHNLTQRVARRELVDLLEQAAREPDAVIRQAAE